MEKENYFYLLDNKMFMCQCKICKCHFYSSEKKIKNKHLILSVESLTLSALKMMGNDLLKCDNAFKNFSLNDLLDFYYNKALGVAEDELLQNKL